MAALQNDRLEILKKWKECPTLDNTPVEVLY